MVEKRDIDKIDLVHNELVILIKQDNISFLYNIWSLVKLNNIRYALEPHKIFDTPVNILLNLKCIKYKLEQILSTLSIRVTVLLFVLLVMSLKLFDFSGFKKVALVL